ncbi:MAG TPA: hypothetical protein ENI66_00340 [Candidatus Yonathbacteria bacterium]|nr:hypothetical protein [Candidatus Yonathbacteria bacterium]
MPASELIVRFNMEFKRRLWKTEIYEALCSYSQLCDPITVGRNLEKAYSESIMLNDAVNGMRYRLKSEGKVVTKEVEEEYRNKAITDYNASVESALSNYQRQMIVLFSTYIEVIAQNFIEWYFSNNPITMHDYVSEEKGKISFSEFINHDSKNEFIESLAKRSASNVISGEWKRILKRIESLTKVELKGKEGILILLSTRNKIVHENAKIEVGDEGVYDFYETLSAFLEYCEKVYLSE